jgi:hypothetical protein
VGRDTSRDVGRVKREWEVGGGSRKGVAKKEILKLKYYLPRLIFLSRPPPFTNSLPSLLPTSLLTLPMSL